MTMPMAGIIYARFERTVREDRKVCQDFSSKRESLVKTLPLQPAGRVAACGREAHGADGERCEFSNRAGRRSLVASSRSGFAEILVEAGLV